MWFIIIILYGVRSIFLFYYFILRSTSINNFSVTIIERRECPVSQKILTVSNEKKESSSGGDDCDEASSRLIEVLLITVVIRVT
jgi:hypothetical protein